MRHGHNRDTSSGSTAENRDCPPGLAKKDNGCLPPGQAKKLNQQTEH